MLPHLYQVLSDCIVFQSSYQVLSDCIVFQSSYQVLSDCIVFQSWAWAKWNHCAIEIWEVCVLILLCSGWLLGWRLVYGQCLVGCLVYGQFDHFWFGLHCASKGFGFWWALYTGNMKHIILDCQMPGITEEIYNCSCSLSHILSFPSVNSAKGVNWHFIDVTSMTEHNSKTWIVCSDDVSYITDTTTKTWIVYSDGV